MTKKEKEIVEKIKDKYKSIASFFKLWDQIISDTSLTIQQKHDMYQMIIKEQPTATENAKEIGKLLKFLNDGYTR